MANLLVSCCFLEHTTLFRVPSADPTRKATLSKLAVLDDTFQFHPVQNSTPGLALALNEGLDIELEQ